MLFFQQIQCLTIDRDMYDKVTVYILLLKIYTTYCICENKKFYYSTNSSQLYSYGIKSNASFKDVQTRKTYSELQDILYKKAAEISDCIGKEFNRIYFDLLWNDRYKKSGNNLF